LISSQSLIWERYFELCCIKIPSEKTIKAINLHH
jgi:hypothetical protein